jgi:hypothetical protein
MKVNRRILFLFLAILAAIVVGVGWVTIIPLFRDHSIEVAGFPPIRYPGFQTWPTLRDFDGPGTVFTLTDGVFDPKGKLSSRPERVGEEFLGELHSSGQWNATVLEKFSGTLLDFGASAGTNLNVDFEPSTVERWRVTPDKTNEEIRKMAHEFHDISLFLIVEAISVRQFTYNLHRHVLSDTKPTFKKDVLGSIELKESAEGNDKISIVRKFDKPFYLFYRPTKINIVSGLAEPQILLTDTDSVLHWSREIVPAKR